MAIDGNFMVFIVPAIIALLAAAVALPSKSRIESDPSTAYSGGKKALVSLSAILALVMGLILALLGATQNVDPIVGGMNMVQIGGISLIIMAVLLLIGSMSVGRQIKTAGQGEHEMVLEVAAVPITPPPSGGAPPPRGPPPRGPPRRDLPPRPGPGSRDLPPRPGPPPRDQGPPMGVPPPRDLPPRQSPPPRDDRVPLPPRVERRRPPPRYPSE